jgi:hypothetical protein
VDLTGVNILRSTCSTSIGVKMRLKRPESPGYDAKQKGFPIQGFPMLGVLPTPGTINHFYITCHQ